MKMQTIKMNRVTPASTSWSNWNIKLCFSSWHSKLLIFQWISNWFRVQNKVNFIIVIWLQSGNISFLFPCYFIGIDVRSVIFCFDCCVKSEFGSLARFRYAIDNVKYGNWLKIIPSKKSLIKVSFIISIIMM